MRVIWIDPGETVGWATGRVWTQRLQDDAIAPPGDLPQLEVLEYGNTKLKTFALSLLEAARRYDVIGFETYRVFGNERGMKANAGSTVPTLQLVGMIRLAAWNAQRARGDGLPQIAERTPLQKTGGMGALKIHGTPKIQAAVSEALDGRHDDGHYADALLHLYGWYHDRFHSTKGAS